MTSQRRSSVSDLATEISFFAPDAFRRSLIEHCAPTFLHAILESATTLSLDNFGAKAIEKSLKSEHFPSTFMGPFIDAICNASEECVPSHWLDFRN